MQLKSTITPRYTIFHFYTFEVVHKWCHAMEHVNKSLDFVDMQRIFWMMLTESCKWITFFHIKVTDYALKYPESWISYIFWPGLPSVVELLLYYIASLSAGLAVLNVVPCFMLDGQHVLRVLVQCPLQDLSFLQLSIYFVIKKQTLYIPTLWLN